MRLNWPPPPSILRVRSDEVHRKLQNDIYLLKCTNFGIQYVGEKITTLNLRMNIHRKGKSDIFLGKLRNVYKNAAFLIHWKVTKSLGYGYGTEVKDML